MNKGIVITAWTGGKDSLEVLLSSIKAVEYPIFVWFNGVAQGSMDWFHDLSWKQKFWDSLNSSLVIGYYNLNDNFELGAIKGALDHTHFDEFVLLQDTVEVLNQDIFRILLEDYEGKSVAYNPHFQMYLGKYRRPILQKVEIPIPLTKAEAVRYEETFHRQYREADPETVIFNHRFVDENFYGSWEERFGRTNLVLRDDYLIKRKGTWDAKQL